MLKKILFSLFTLTFLLLPWQNALAETVTQNGPVYIFSSPTCPHCATAKKFLENFKKESSPNLIIYDYEISRNAFLAKNFYEKYSVPQNMQGLVPAIFVGDKYFVGFSAQTGEEIAAYLLDQEEVKKEGNGLTKLPILGEVDLLDLSLPILAITLGLIDGFNVCSLGALVIILGLVMVLHSRRRIFIFGGAFIFTTAIIYGLLIFLWHQFFSFIAPYIRSMELLIGLLALAGGIYLLREFYKAYKSGPICSTNNLMSRLTPKIEKVFQSKSSWLALLSAVIVFATVVTIVEFPCSAFLPVLFTSILVDSGISLGTSLFYIMLYMLFYLLDEIIIFIAAVLTLKIKIVSPKFIIFFNLLAAAIFIFLGITYLLGSISW
ncbi:MAG: glutaredoxin domain-containing protein [Patescibacteria group bacterium]|nr:glutaredoxin domain-containing protein [Patescibacteria group bacterium]